MVDLDKVRYITLEPGKRLVILVMNADQYSPHGPLWITPRAPVDQYLGMHVTRNCAQHSYAGHGRRLHDQTNATSDIRTAVQTCFRQPAHPHPSRTHRARACMNFFVLVSTNTLSLDRDQQPISIVSHRPCPLSLPLSRPPWVSH